MTKNQFEDSTRRFGWGRLVFIVIYLYAVDSLYLKFNSFPKTCSSGRKKWNYVSFWCSRNVLVGFNQRSPSRTVRQLYVSDLVRKFQETRYVANIKLEPTIIKEQIQIEVFGTNSRLIANTSQKGIGSAQISKCKAKLGNNHPDWRTQFYEVMAEKIHTLTRNISFNYDYDYFKSSFKQTKLPIPK